MVLGAGDGYSLSPWDGMCKQCQTVEVGALPAGLAALNRLLILQP